MLVQRELIISIYIKCVRLVSVTLLSNGCIRWTVCIIRIDYVTTPRIQVINRQLFCTVVSVLDTYGIVSIQSKALEQFSLGKTTDTGISVISYGITGLLAVSNVVFHIIAIEATIRTEEATPTPHICIGITTGIRFCIFLVVVAEATTYLQPVSNVGSNVHGYIVTTELIRIESHDTFFLVVTQRHVVRSLSAGTLYRNVVVLSRLPVAVHNAYYVPVSIIETLTCFIVQVKVIARNHFTITGLTTVTFQPVFCLANEIIIHIHTEQFIFQTGTFIGCTKGTSLCCHVWIVRQNGRSCPREVVGIVDLYSVHLLGALCSNQYHTKCSTCTINRSRSSILQYGDVFNIVRVDKRKVVDNHTIQYDKRSTLRTVTQCTGTTDSHNRSFTQLTTGIQYGQTRNNTLQSLTDITLRTAFHSLCHIHSCNGTSQVGLLLSTVTYYYHFFQQFRIFYKIHGNP